MASNRRRSPRSSYPEGNFARARGEIAVTDLPVAGAISGHLGGRYVRIGPCPIADSDPASDHWFRGTGVVHGVRLCDGRAEWYRIGAPGRRFLACGAEQ